MAHSLIGWNGVLALYTNEWIPYSSVSGTSSPSRIFIQPAPFAALFIEKELVQSTSLRFTSPLSALRTLADGLSALTASSTAPAFSAETRSHLDKIKTSANSIWLVRSGPTFLRSVFSTESANCSRISFAVAMFASKDAQSTMVTQVSSLAISFRVLFPLSALVMDSRVLRCSSCSS